MYRLRSLVVAAFAVSLSAPAAAATFRVGAGGGCTHATIQDAIDDAAADPDVADFIRVTRSAVYDDVALDIEDQHLVIEGGYASCTTETPDNTRTTLTGNGDDSVIRIRGYGDIVLRKLTVTGGHQPRFDYGFGGGIRISGGPHLITSDHLLVTGNDAGHGGGISLVNDISGNPNDVRFVLGDDSVVSFNEAGFALGAGSMIQGGGVYCHESSFEMSGGGSTSITSNTAEHDGGGIGANEATSQSHRTARSDLSTASC